MSRRKHDPGQILRPPNPPDPRWWPVAGEHPEPLEMSAQSLAAALGLAGGLIDDCRRVADQFKVLRVERVRHFDRMDQREPFGFGVAANAEIVADKRNAPHDDRHFDATRIGPASAIEENPEPGAWHQRDPMAGNFPIATGPIEVWQSAGSGCRVRDETASKDSF